MGMKSVLAVLGVLIFPSSGVLAQPATSAETPDVPADVEEWMRTAWGMEPEVLGATDTHFLSSLSASERQGAFLFKQRCNTCHYSTLSTTRGARGGLVSEASYGPTLSKRNVEGEGRERAVRLLISEGSATMPAFKYALRPEQIDSIIGYLKRVETLRPPVVDRLVEVSSPSVAKAVSPRACSPTATASTISRHSRLDGHIRSGRRPRPSRRAAQTSR